MDNWTLTPNPDPKAEGTWIIRGSYGRTVAHVQYEQDARLIMEAVQEKKNKEN